MDNNFTSLIQAVVKIIGSYGFAGVLLVLVCYWLVLPEKAEKASAHIYKLLRFFWHGAEKRYIKHDIQSHVNDYVNNFLTKNIKNFKPVNLKLQWVDEVQDEEHFIKSGSLVVRMRVSDNQSRNMVNASMIFIAQNLLPKTKHYISGKQKRSIDLFVANKLFETQKESIVKQFVEDYLVGETSDKKIGDFYEKYYLIDKAGIFFPVFLEEMNFLGEKVFPNRRDNVIFQEVGGLIEFLHKHATRIVGTDSSAPIFSGEYCRFGIVIVGRNAIIAARGQTPYVNHIKALAGKNAETIYLIAPHKNSRFLSELCSDMFLEGIGYEVYNELDYKAVIYKDQDLHEEVSNHLVVLRKKKINHYIRAHNVTT